MASLLQILSPAKGTQRVMIVTLSSVPLLLIAISTLPAFAVLPFLPNGIDRAGKLMASLIIWTHTILKDTGA
jgi:hypothetical protein